VAPSLFRDGGIIRLETLPQMGIVARLKVRGQAVTLKQTITESARSTRMVLRRDRADPNMNAHYQGRNLRFQSSSNASSVQGRALLPAGPRRG
jgi:hypothetical protein